MPSPDSGALSVRRNFNLDFIAFGKVMSIQRVKRAVAKDGAKASRFPFFPHLIGLLARKV